MFNHFASDLHEQQVHPGWECTYFRQLGVLHRDGREQSFSTEVHHGQLCRCASSHGQMNFQLDQIGNANTLRENWLSELL